MSLKMDKELNILNEESVGGEKYEDESKQKCKKHKSLTEAGEIVDSPEVHKHCEADKRELKQDSLNFDVDDSTKNIRNPDKDMSSLEEPKPGSSESHAQNVEILEISSVSSENENSCENPSLVLGANDKKVKYSKVHELTMMSKVLRNMINRGRRSRKAEKHGISKYREGDRRARDRYLYREQERDCQLDRTKDRNRHSVEETDHERYTRRGWGRDQTSSGIRNTEGKSNRHRRTSCYRPRSRSHGSRSNRHSQEPSPGRNPDSIYVVPGPSQVQDIESSLINSHIPHGWPIINYPVIPPEVAPESSGMSSSEASMKIITDDEEVAELNDRERRKKEQLVQKVGDDAKKTANLQDQQETVIVYQESVVHEANLSFSNPENEKKKEIANNENQNEGGVEVEKEAEVQKEEDVVTRSKRDMLSNEASYNAPSTSTAVLPASVNESSPSLTNNFDIPGGYCRVQGGEILDEQYIVCEFIGQGEFANVFGALDLNRCKSKVAIKIIRSNEFATKSGIQELETLKRLISADPHDKFHCIRLFSYFYHKKHLCLVLQPLSMNLYQVIMEYGKNRGVHIGILRSYTYQLLMALKLLERTGIIHGDIKPDNILVNDNKQILKVCDFGSSFHVSENEYSPYIGARYYRAPEIILGTSYGPAIDIWATACTIYEMSTGNPMFSGETNNQMLKGFMDLKGKLPNKMIKKGLFKDLYFDAKYNFLYKDIDFITEEEKTVVIRKVHLRRDLRLEIACAHPGLTPTGAKKLNELKDLLQSMLMMDPAKRASVNQCIAHPFVQCDF